MDFENNQDSENGIRRLSRVDAVSVANIYNHYVERSIATFDEQEIDPSEIEFKIDQKLPWIGYQQGDMLYGYAYASNWKARCAYKHSLETSIYLHPQFLGKGIGTLLYSKLLNTLKQMGFHTAIGGISLPNKGSVRLHEKLGFEKIAHFKEVGFKFNKWIDVGYWQIVLDDIKF